MVWLCTCTRMPDGNCFLRDVMKRTARNLHTPSIHFYSEPNAVLDHTIFDHMILLPDRGQDSTQKHTRGHCRTHSHHPRPRV